MKMKDTILWAIALLLIVFYFFNQRFGPTEARVESDAVVERDGVLYFPDGSPVRNYEQLYIYEHSK